MKIFITFVSSLILTASVNAATTVVNVGGSNYIVTYDTDTTYTANSGSISGQTWFDQGGFGTEAQTWANATSVANVRYAFSVSGSDVGYFLADGSSGSSIASAATSASGSYAISAVAVPAPLPILGILPVVGFLKRMRKRQRA